ncbi:MAG: tetratricopeptide repeat protein [Lachnospiraceae bacterium]|nr:tetratricopeptide repeat protein [Lachnospiraceae bacterium]
MALNENISKNDYEEPRCLLDMHPECHPIPMDRVIDRLDSYFNHKKYSAAEQHLRYWLTEAESCRDMRGKLAVLNEQIGLYRKLGKEEECLQAISDALTLAETMNIDNTVTYATTLINAATGYKAFGKADKALPLYDKAQTIYESDLRPDDSRLGGLYNNMALTVMELGDFSRAENMFYQALEVMKRIHNSEAEQAITWCNLADLIEKRSDACNVETDKMIAECMEKAMDLLDSKNLKRDGYYAFVCDKCSSAFGYHGYFMYDKELKRRAEEIYERT